MTRSKFFGSTATFFRFRFFALSVGFLGLICVFAQANVTNPKTENYCFIDGSYSGLGNDVRINTLFEGKDTDGKNLKIWINVQCNVDRKKGCSGVMYNLLLPLTVANPQSMDKWYKVASIVGPEAVLDGGFQKITFNTKTGKATLFSNHGKESSEAQGSCN